MSEQNESGENTPVTVFGKIFRPKDFKHLMQFYTADHQLTIDDRKALAADTQSLTKTVLLWSFFETTVAFLFPTGLQQYRNYKKGIPFAGHKAPFLHRPLLSVVLASVTQLTSQAYFSYVMRESQIKDLENRSTDSLVPEDVRQSLARQLNVWRVVEARNMTLISLYYHETAVNPSLILQNPQKMADKEPHSVHYLPPPEKKLGDSVLESVKEHERNAPHWAKIREQHGFVAQGLLSDEDETELGSSDPAEPAPAEKKTEPVSAWEKLRGGK